MVFPIFGSYPCTSTPPAALAIDSIDTGHNSITFPGTSTFNNVAGTLLILPAIVTSDAGTPAFSTITYGGSALTLLPGSSINWDAGANPTVAAIYYLVNPKKGSNTISIGASSPGASYTDVIWGAISFVGQNASSPLGTPATAVNTSNVSPATVTITGTTANNFVLAFAATGSGFISVSSPFTQAWVDNISGNTSGDNGILAYDQTPGGSLSPSISLTPDNWGIVAVEVKH